MASAVGSGVAAFVALLVICGFALVLMRYFLPLRTTPSYLTVPIFISLVLPISTILLVPIDLASTTRPDDEAGSGIWLPDEVVRVAWRVTYWLMFVLTWLVLPILGEYLDSGYRKPRDRFIYSLKSNGQFWLIVIACSVLGAVYVLIQNGFNGASFKALVMALAYFAGLLQAIYMMGHGLVVIPRRLMRNANIAERLKRIQSAALKVHENMEDALQETLELDQQLQQLRRKSDLSPEHEEWVEDLVDVTSISQSRRQANTMSSSRAPPAAPSFITDRYLADLGRHLQRSRHKRDRYVAAWHHLVQDSVRTQAILDSKASHSLTFPVSSGPLLLPGNMLTPYVRYNLHTKVLPGLRLVAAGLLSVASVCIVWSELVKFAAPWLSIISFTVVHGVGDEDAQVGFGGQVVAAAWIMYMCAAVLASFGEVKVWGNRALVRRNTYGESACWYAAQIAKLTVPLAYNFLSFIPPATSKRTIFYGFLGQLIDLTRLGDWIDNIFPMLILIPVGAALFNLYGRLKRVIGFELVEEDEEESAGGYGTGGWREGRSLIEAELQGRSDLDTTSLLGDQEPGHSAGRRPDGRGTVARAAPSLYIPPVEDSSAEHVADRPRRQLGTNRPSASAAREAPEEDENALSGFAHRLRNTVDSIERPEWLNSLGKRPKWMGGDETSGRADFGRGLGRWFGGRPSDGQVRL